MSHFKEMDQMQRAIGTGLFLADVTAKDLGLRDEVGDGKKTILVMYEAFNGSLDAARLLHSYLLHDETVVEVKCCDAYHSVVRLRLGAYQLAEVTDTNAARAWLIAILRSACLKAGAA